MKQIQEKHDYELMLQGTYKHKIDRMGRDMIAK